MFNLHTQMPLGNVSVGINFPDQEKAVREFERVSAQVSGWQPYAIDVVLEGDGEEIRREHFNA